jgi:hypothetical protein
MPDPRTNPPPLEKRNVDCRRFDSAEAEWFTAEGPTHDVKLQQEAFELRQLRFTSARQLA